MTGLGLMGQHSRATIGVTVTQNKKEIALGRDHRPISWTGGVNHVITQTDEWFVSTWVCNRLTH